MQTAKAAVSPGNKIGLISNIFDFGIIGAGFAGLSLADALQETNQKVVVVEKNAPGAGASGTPGALVNPATGRRGTKSWKAEACYNAISKNLEKVQKYSPLPFFHRNGVLRPAQTEKMARKMKAQFDKTDWPKGWCYWLSENEIKQKHPSIHCINGGLWLPVGMTVNGKKYCSAYALWLQKKGVEIRTNFNAEVERKNNYLILQSRTSTVKCKNLIFAAGYEAVTNPFWKDLKLEPIKGQLALFESKEKLKFNHSVSGLGYIAKLQNDYKFIQGSTYEHDFNEVNTGKQGADYLKKRLSNMLPVLATKAELVSQWSGVRISAPNRKPVVGRHSEYKNLFLFTGLGSKGLLYSKFTANHFVDNLLNKTPLFKKIVFERLLS